MSLVQSLQLPQPHEAMAECNKTAGSSIRVPKGTFLQTSSWCGVDIGKRWTTEAMQRSYLPSSRYLTIGSFSTSIQPDKTPAQCTSLATDIKLYWKSFEMWYIFFKMMNWLFSRFVVLFLQSARTTDVSNCILSWLNLTAPLGCLCSCKMLLRILSIVRKSNGGVKTKQTNTN